MKRLFLLLPALWLAACAANPATGGYNLSLTSPKEQRELGDRTATATLAAEGVYRPTSAATLYVNDLCNRIYAVTEAAAEPVQCNLIDTNEVNAFATPGYLSFHRGLLAYLSSEDELASIIGHEAGHLTSRHVARSVTAGRVADIFIMGAVAGVAATTAASDPASLEGLSTVGQQASTVGRMAFSRDYEREADSLGRRYMQAAGFAPTGSVDAQQAMLLYNGYMEQRLQAAFGGEKASVLDRLKSSHPPSQERLDTARKDAGDAPMSSTPDAGRTRYMQAIEGLAFGPARRYGIARQNELVLTRERVVLPLPAGSTTEYLSSGSFDDLGTWLVGHPQSGTYVRVNAYKSVTGRSPAATLAKLLPALNSGVQRMAIGQPVLATSAEEGDDETPTSTDEDTADLLADTAAEDLGQLPHREVIGYTATYRYLNSPKRFRVVAFETATRRNKMMVLTAIYPNDEVMQREDANLMAILKNVRFLTRTEALKYKQLYLHAFTAAAGETVAQKAAHLPVGAYQEPLFRALNNLPEGQDLQPGQLYKTIVDPNS